MGKDKAEVVTFKADTALLEAMRGVPNRSAFIRAAVLSALDGACPLCGGTGILTPNQRRHWNEFYRDHRLEECDDCNEYHLVCVRKQAAGVHRRTRAAEKAGGHEKKTAGEQAAARSKKRRRGR